MVAIAILAGGSSERMGTDKARLLVDGVSLIGQVAKAVAPVGRSLTIVGGPADLQQLVESSTADRPVAHVADEFPGEGPLGGIITALRAVPKTGSDGVLLTVACDLPSLVPAEIKHLVAEAQTTRSQVAVPMIDGQRQWHVAVWSQRALPVLEGEFDNGTRSIWRAAANLRQTVVVTSTSAHHIDLDSPADVDAYIENKNSGKTT